MSQCRSSRGTCRRGDVRVCVCAYLAGPLPLSIDQLACLLRKEQHNSYGILAPPWLIEQQKQLDTNRQDPQHSMQQDSTTANVQGQSQPLGTDNMMGDEEMSEGSEENGRLLRGSALYSLASLINHECNPNVARFDSFDVPGPGSTSVVFRAMHDLPAGKCRVDTHTHTHTHTHTWIHVHGLASSCMSLHARTASRSAPECT